MKRFIGLMVLGLFVFTVNPVVSYASNNAEKEKVVVTDFDMYAEVCVDYSAPLNGSLEYSKSYLGTPYMEPKSVGSPTAITNDYYLTVYDLLVKHSKIHWLNRCTLNLTKV